MAGSEPPSAAARTAFITGASYGIGAAVAAKLARDGFDLVLAATKTANLDRVRTRLESGGTKVAAVAVDIRSPESVKQAMDDALRAAGSLDVLVNNAGITLRSSALDMSAAEWSGVLETNATGTFLMSQAMARHLAATGRPGCIINITSTHGLVGMAGRMAYGVSKAAVIHMTRMLAIEWAALGIRVNSVAPGRVESDSPLRAATSGDTNYLAAALKRVPLQRFASVEDVAEAVAYLASPGASYITGHTLVLDGGLTAQ